MPTIKNVPWNAAVFIAMRYLARCCACFFKWDKSFEINH